MFGQVIQGKSLVRKIENIPTQPGDAPVEEVKVADCGVLSEEEFSAMQNAESTQDGDVYEDWPEDDESLEDKPEQALKIAAALKNIGTDYFKKGDFVSALEKYQSTFFFVVICCDPSFVLTYAHNLQRPYDTSTSTLTRTRPKRTPRSRLSNSLFSTTLVFVLLRSLPSPRREF